MSIEGLHDGSHADDLLRLAINQEMGVQRSMAPGVLRLWSVSPPQHEIRLKEVVAIIRPQRWNHTKLRVQRLRIQAFTQMRVLGRGRERGLRYLPRKGAASGVGVRYLPKRMISWIVEEAQVAPLVEAIIEANQTGQLGDGKIFVLPVEDAMRIRTQEHGVEALRTETSVGMVMGTTHASTTTPEPEYASRQ